METRAVESGSPEFYRRLFAQANDAQYILDLETQVFLDVNPAFETLTGYSREDLVSGRIRAPQIVARESLATYMQKRETRRIAPSDRYDLRLLCRGGERRPVEISVQRMQMDGRTVIVGSMRDLTARKKLEQEMWDKIEELGYANSRIFALTEKIRRVPEFVPQLLPLANEDDLLSRTAELLCARGGLGYESVSFYLAEEGALCLRASTQPVLERRIPLQKEHRLVRIYHGTESPVLDAREAVLPLKGRERNLGVIEVRFHPKEVEVLEGNQRALQGYLDLLETIAEMIGLLVENLRLYETVRLQSIVDQLTGVFNRRYLDSKLGDELHRAGRYQRALSLLMIDLDNFKEINDTLGHKQGDAVLRETGRLLQSHTREVDFVCRYGGDEFAVLMPETAFEGVRTKAEALRREVENHPFRNLEAPASPVRVTLSIGTSSYCKELSEGELMLRAADEALYHAKRGGRNAVWTASFDPAGVRYERFTTP